MLNYKYRLYPNKACINRLESTLEACRFVYNYFVNNGYTNEYDMNNILLELKELYPWLRDYHSKMLQMVSKQVASVVKALKELKKQGYKIGSVKIKSKDEYNTFIYNQSGFKLVNSNSNGKYYLWLSKIGYIRIKMHRYPNNYRIKQVIVTKNNNKWYAVFTLQIPTYPIFQFKPITLNNIIALDINSTNARFIVASNNDDNEFDINNERINRRLRLMQRKLSRRNKGSNNYKKAKNRLQIIHERIERRRKDLLHKISRYYTSKYDVIMVEDLNVKYMLEHKPLITGNNTLHRNIANKAFNRFMQLLSYKTKVIKVNPKNTTKECYRCNNIQDMPLHERIYRCNKCNLIIDRDRNSSLNILKKGLMKLGLIKVWYEYLSTLGARGSYACGDPLGSMKQEALSFMAG